MYGTTRDSTLDLLYHLQRRTSQNFNEPFRTFDWSVPEATTAAWQPVVDIFEEADAIRLVAEVPGVRPEDVKISVEGNLLTIRGVKEQVAEAKAETAKPHLIKVEVVASAKALQA